MHCPRCGSENLTIVSYVKDASEKLVVKCTECDTTFLATKKEWRESLVKEN